MAQTNETMQSNLSFQAAAESQDQKQNQTQTQTQTQEPSKTTDTTPTSLPFGGVSEHSHKKGGAEGIFSQS
jgi:hypothetical protein